MTTYITYSMNLKSNFFSYNNNRTKYKFSIYNTNFKNRDFTKNGQRNST